MFICTQKTDIMQLFLIKIFFAHKKLKNPSTKIAHNSKLIFFSSTGPAAWKVISGRYRNLKGSPCLLSIQGVQTLACMFWTPLVTWILNSGSTNWAFWGPEWWKFMLDQTFWNFFTSCNLDSLTFKSIKIQIVLRNKINKVF